MYLSRREALASTAATVSMLAAPSVLALPASWPPCYAPEFISFDFANYPLRETSCSFYKHQDNSDRELVGRYHVLDCQKHVFGAFNKVARLFLPARFGANSDPAVRQRCYELLSDRRAVFMLPEDVIDCLEVRTQLGPIMFDKSRTWMMFTTLDEADKTTVRSMLAIRRRDRVGAYA